MRQGELLGLTWDEVDFRAGTLTVRHALQRIDDKPVLVEPKTNRSRRTLSVPASAMSALQAHRNRQLFRRQIEQNTRCDLDLVFTSSVGTPMEPSNVSHWFQAILAEPGLPRQRFHDLRHCCASLLLAQRVPARVVMEQLGHSQISLTMNTYSHVMPSALKEAADALELAITGSG